MTDPKSNQEAILALLSERSFGACFVFKPPTYKKGKAEREPPDIVWIANDTLVAINATARNSATLDKMTQHNFGQLHGWLRAWRNGLPLTGRNAYKTFNLSSGEIEHVVLLSIVDGPNAAARHEENELKRPHAAALGVTFAATLPQEAIAAFASYGGSQHDLLDVLGVLRSISGTLSSVDAVRLITQRAESAVEAGIAAALSGAAETPGSELALARDNLATRAEAARRALLGMRVGLIEPTNHEQYGYVFEVFSDLSWSQVAALATIVAITITPSAPFASRSVPIKIGPYSWIIGYMRDPAQREPLTQRLVEAIRAGRDEPYPPTALIYCGQSPVMICANRRTGPSQIASRLTATRQGL